MSWQAPVDPITMLSTQLNALASLATSAVGTEFDNTTRLMDSCTFNFLSGSFGASPLGANLEIYIVTDTEGVYSDGSAGVAPSTTQLLATIALRSATGVHNVDKPQSVDLPAKKFKLVITNKALVALPAAGNVLKMFPQRKGTT